MPDKILLIEDEEDLASIVAYNLQKEGFSVEIAASGAKGFELLEAKEFSLILLDLMLPDMSGIDICKKIRSRDEWGSLPIIMVTAKGEEIDRVVGFEVGADDYVVKPFSARELILRVKAVLRRQTTKEPEASNRLNYRCFTIDISAHKAYVDEAEIFLTALEFKLLQTFIERKGLVQTRERLLEDVWNMDPNVNTRTVDKHVQRLRQKLGSAADYIETIRGIGYRLKVE